MVTDESAVLVKEEEVAVVAFSVDGMRRLRSNRTPEVEDGEEGVCLVVDSSEDEDDGRKDDELLLATAALLLISSSSSTLGAFLLCSSCSVLK